MAPRTRGIPSSGWPAYLFAVSAMAVSLLAGLALHPWFNLQGYLFFIPGIVFVARWCGFGPGLLSTVLAAAAVNLIFPPARGALAVRPADRVTTVVLFVAVGGVISALCETLRRHAEAARQARNRAEGLLVRQTLLANAIRVLAGSLDTDTLFTRIADVVVPAVGDSCGLHAVSDTGTVRLVTVRHRDPAMHDVLWAFASRKAGTVRGWGRVLHDGVPELMADVTDTMRREAVPDAENRARLDALGITSQISVPLVARGRTLGALTIALGPGKRRFNDEDLVVACEIAAVAAIALDNAALYEGAVRHERVLAEAVRESEAARTHADFIAGVGRLVSASLDYEQTIAAATAAAVPRLADYCCLLLANDAGELRQVASAHVDRQQATLLHALGERYSARLNAPDTPAAVVVNTGRPLLVPVADADRLGHAVGAAGGMAPLIAEMITALSARSYLGVPLRGRGGVTGAITFVMAESGRTFSPADIRLAEEFADRVSAAVEHARLFKAAEESNRVKDEFLSTLSHELRTPLNAVLGWSRMLAAGQASGAAAQRAADGIYRNAKLQLRLVEDILDVARGLAGKLHLELAQVDAGAVVEASIASVLASAAGRGISIVRHLPTFPVVVTADEGRLRQIVDNLLSNAIKFSLPGGRVELRLEQDHGTATLVVRDYGVGIPADFLPHVFERFRQADASSTRSHGGLGLGLSIVRQLVELHGGTVTAESAGREHGATFTVRLPAVLSGDSRDAHVGATEALDEALLAGVPILIVDDDQDHLEVAAAVLSAHGADVTTAGSALEAEQAMARRLFRLLIVDLSMPVTDGFALVARVRQRPNLHREVPAVALSADVSEGARRRAQAAGFTVHVAKPFDAVELVNLAHALTSAESTPEPSR